MPRQIDKIRVLIVNSKEILASSLAAALNARYDYEVKTAKSNFEAGTIVAKFFPSVMLVCPEFSEEINPKVILKLNSEGRSSSFQGKPCIQTIITGRASAKMAAGFDGHISDPSDTRKVIAEIKRVLATT